MRDIKLLQPPARQGIENALAELQKQGIPHTVNSTLRSNAEQRALYANRAKNKYPVARPGTSAHEKGKAVDLSIPPEYRAAANEILQKNGWKWHGPSDVVHYDYIGTDVTGPTVEDPYGLKSSGLATTQSASDPYGLASSGLAGNTTQADDPYGLKSSGLTPQSGYQLPSYDELRKGMSAGYGQEPEAQTQDRGFLGNITNYWSEVGHNVFGNSGLNLPERLGAAAKPLVDLGDFALGGFANPNFSPVSTAFQKTIAPVYAGLAQLATLGNERVQKMLEVGITKTANIQMLLNASRIDSDIAKGQTRPEDLDWYHQNRFQIENARRTIWEPTRSGAEARRLVANSVAKAFNGEPDATLPRGGIFAAAVGQDNWLTEALGLYFDAKVLGAATKPVTSLIHGAPGLANAVERFSPKAAGALREGLVAGPVGRLRDVGIGKLFKATQGNRAGTWAATRLQELTNAGEDYRAGQAIKQQQFQAMRGAQTELVGLHRQIIAYGDKLKAAGKEVMGNFLKDTEYDRPGLPLSHLADAAIESYAEAGGTGAFFPNESAVLMQAAKMGVDPEWVARVGERAKQIGYKTGQALVDAGMLSAEDFAKNAGTYTRRLYRLGNMTSEEAGQLLKQMVDEGQTDGRTAALLQQLHIGGGDNHIVRVAKGVDPTKAVRQRVIEDAAERADMLPELSFIKSSGKSVIQQLKAAAAQHTMNAFADPVNGLSAAAELLVKDYVRPAVVERAKFKGELTRVLTNIKQATIQRDEVLGKQIAELQGKLTKREAEVAHYGQARTQHLVAEPVPPKAPEPTAPASPAPSKKAFAFGASFKDTAAEKVTREYAGRQVAEGVGVARLRVKDLLDTARTMKYARELSGWQKEYEAWQKKGQAIDEQWQRSQAEYAKARVLHEQALQQADAHAEEMAKLERRRELLSGGPATVANAEDALTAAEEKLRKGSGLPPDHPIVPDEMRPYWQKKWLDYWNKYNEDIFDEMPPTGLPRVPGGMPADVVEAMGRGNPLIAAALDESLSLPGEVAMNPANQRPGWIVWPEDGYGAMSGRYASSALKDMIDDAVNPNRFFGVKNHAINEFVKTMGGFFRHTKLYFNPSTHLSVYIQSFLEGYATVADAGVAFNPITYLKGQKEMANYYKTGEITPAVQGVLDAGIEMGGGIQSGVDPMHLRPLDPTSAKSLPSRVAQAARQKFVDIQNFPKAGVTKILIESGVEPKLAAQIAERGYGGRGIIQGGIESPGTLKLADELNKSGIAMFTAYPLHSANRIMQLLVTRPDIAMQFPVLKMYLLRQADPAMQEASKENRLKPTEVPLPEGLRKFLNIPREVHPAVDMSNLIPHAGVFQPFDPPNVMSSLQMYLQQVGDLGKRGLNPEDAAQEKSTAAARAFGPGLVSQLILMEAAMKGLNPTSKATRPQTIPEAAGAFLGVRSRDIQLPVEQALNDEKATEVPARLKFMQDYEQALMDNRERPEDHAPFVRAQFPDPVTLQRGFSAAGREMHRLTTDRSISDKRALTMIRHQQDYIQAFYKVANEQGIPLQSFELAQ